MHITDIRLQNFRNYADRTVELTEKVNLITGKNAQGKTNLLESIFVCCVGKSVRARDRELIAHGQDRARIRMTAERFEGRVQTEMVLSRGENKRILVNGIPLSRTGELLGTVKAIYFSPEDLKLIKDAQLDDAVIKLKSLEAFQKAADGQATKIIIPSEIQGIAGLAASVKELVKD